jgi:hypothetical protein
LPIVDFQLPIGLFRNWPIGNRHLAMGNLETHPLPQTVLTSLPVLMRIGLVRANNDNEFLNRQKAT